MQAQSRKIMFVSAFLISFMLIGTFVELSRAFTLHAVLNTWPYWGDRGGYHDVVKAWEDQLKWLNISIDTGFYEMSTLTNIIRGETWNQSGADGGWDITCNRLWLSPAGLLWLPSRILSTSTPPNGRNIMGWTNEKADNLYMKATRTIDLEVRKKYLWLWQEEFMHDPPMINMFYSKLWMIESEHIEGYDPTVWLTNITHLRRLDGGDSIRFPVMSDMFVTCPLFTGSVSQEAYNDLVFDMLYVTSRDPWPDGPFKVVPQLAADYPTFLDEGRTVVVPLRQDVLWSDGEAFNAEDVNATFDAILDPTTYCWAYSDYAGVIESTEITGEYEITFHLYEPYLDILQLFTNDWGAMILPEHKLRGIPHSSLYTHEMNSDPSFLVGTGPFIFDEWVKGDHMKFVRNPNYWGPAPNYDNFIVKIIPDATATLLAVQAGEIDICPNIVQTNEFFEQLDASPDLRCYQYDYSASHCVLLNLNNRHISNRYVRMAMCHSVPFPAIMQIITSWGMDGTTGRALILPQHINDIFNTELEPYEYNLTKAQQYLDMWKFSLQNASYMDGPIGDADFSGCVNLDDVWKLTQNYGKPPEEWPWKPGNDVDPDFDNDGDVDLDDLELWEGSYGTEYPFPGGR